MSYDLMVFAPEVAPREREAFLKWYFKQTEWGEDHSYDDPSVSTPELRAWFEDIIREFPPMNGPFASDEPGDPRATDYSVGRSIIYAAFAWSQAKRAHTAAMHLARKHAVGFMDLTGDDPAIIFPDEAPASGSLGQRGVKKPWWRPR